MAPTATPRADLRAQRRFSFAAAGVLAILALAAALELRHGQDFAVFWRAGGRFIRGEPLYVGADGFLAYRYAPGMALLFAPLSAIPFAAAKALWFALSVVVGALAMRRIAWKLAPKAPDRTALLAAIVLSRPILEEFACGQANLVVLALLVGALGAEDREHGLAAGGLLAAAAALKLSPLVLAADWLLRRRWRALVGLLSAGLALALAAVPFYGAAGAIRLHEAWLASLGHAAPAVASSGGNQSLFGAAARVGLPGSVAAAAAAALVAWGLARPAPEPRRSLLLFTLALASPMGWIQNFVFAFPAVVLLLSATHRATAALALAIGLANLVPIYDVAGPRIEAWYFDHSFMTASMLLLFALVAWLPKPSRAPIAPGAAAPGP